MKRYLTLLNTVRGAQVGLELEEESFGVLARDIGPRVYKAFKQLEPTFTKVNCIGLPESYTAKNSSSRHTTSSKLEMTTRASRATYLIEIMRVVALPCDTVCEIARNYHRCVILLVIGLI